MKKKPSSKPKKKSTPKLDFSQLAALVVAKATGQPTPKGISAEQAKAHDRHAKR